MVGLDVQGEGEEDVQRDRWIAVEYLETQESWRTHKASSLGSRLQKGWWSAGDSGVNRLGFGVCNWRRTFDDPAKDTRCIGGHD